VCKDGFKLTKLGCDKCAAGGGVEFTGDAESVIFFSICLILFGSCLYYLIAQLFGEYLASKLSADLATLMKIFDPEELGPSPVAGSRSISYSELLRTVKKIQASPRTQNVDDAEGILDEMLARLRRPVPPGSLAYVTAENFLEASCYSNDHNPQLNTTLERLREPLSLRPVQGA
jgi:hypothetical protein